MPSPHRITAFTRGVRGRCPSCGSRGIFRGLTELVDHCPSCHYSFVREDGYWVGAMTVAMALVIVLFGAWFVGGMLVTWPDVPWTGLLIGALAINGVVPFVAYGWCKSVWVGLDLAFSPARAEEFRAPLADAGG